MADVARDGASAACTEERNGTTEDVLLVIDVQNDFMPGGALAVPDGDAVVPVINALAQRFEQVVLTQDWHPREHVSFAANHPGRTPFSTPRAAVRRAGVVARALRAGHRRRGLHRDLDIPHARLVIRKGGRAGRQLLRVRRSRSHDAHGLAGYLRELGAKRNGCGLDRLLRRVVGARCARGRLRRRGDRRCVPRDRPERLARARGSRCRRRASHVRRRRSARSAA
jgi:hypothetical protein